MATTCSHKSKWWHSYSANIVKKYFTYNYHIIGHIISLNKGLMDNSWKFVLKKYSLNRYVVAKTCQQMKRTILVAAILMACSNPKVGIPNEVNNSQEPQSTDTTKETVNQVALADTLSATARSMERQGMVNIKSVDPTIEVSLMYSRPDNFTGQVLYKDLREGYLHPKAAQALAKAQKKLKELRPELNLIIFDATRPMSIQQVMWNVVKGTSKNIYVSNPANGGGMHNYGMAVDISICRENGDTIPMGALVDHMSSLSHIDHEDVLVRTKRMTEEARANRQLLREVMAVGGFMPLRTEWWHFNLCTRAEAKRNYKVIR